VFIRVYRLEIYQSCWYFRPSFVNCCSSNLLSASTSPPPPFLMWIIILFVRILYTVTKGRGGGVWGSGPQTDKHLPQSPFTGHFFRWRHCALPSMSLIFLRGTASQNSDDDLSCDSSIILTPYSTKETWRYTYCRYTVSNCIILLYISNAQHNNSSYRLQERAKSWLIHANSNSTTAQQHFATHAALPDTTARIWPALFYPWKQVLAQGLPVSQREERRRERGMLDIRWRGMGRWSQYRRQQNVWS
jgi:hypothetical protein